MASILITMDDLENVVRLNAAPPKNLSLTTCAEVVRLLAGEMRGEPE